jgi:DNA adenine methylase
MKPAKTKALPPAKILGGKAYLARRIIELLPETNYYVEPFGGLASVGLNLPRPTRQNPRMHVYNDTNPAVVQLFLVIRDFPDEFARRLTLTPYSEYAFLDAKESLSADMVERAVDTYVKMQFSFSGKGQSFSASRGRTRRGISDVVAGHLAKIDDNLPLLVEIVRDWQIEQCDAIECIRRHDAPGTLFYMDPTYHPDCKAQGSVYDHEMTHAQHVAFLEAAVAIKGRAAISHYDHPLYNEALKSWRRVEFDIANHAAGGKTKRRMIECLWLNWSESD